MTTRIFENKFKIILGTLILRYALICLKYSICATKYLDLTFINNLLEIWPVT